MMTHVFMLSSKKDMHTKKFQFRRRPSWISSI